MTPSRKRLIFKFVTTMTGAGLGGLLGHYGSLGPIPNRSFNIALCAGLGAFMSEIGWVMWDAHQVSKELEE